MNINPIRKSKSKYNHQKQSTKSCNEDIGPEEEELKKYRELIERLGFLHHKNKNKSKDKSGFLNSDSLIEQNNNNMSSNISRTRSRTKEILNDRDFFMNFINYDNMPILPKNMHLLTDNDTNQNIDDKTKFKNLSDLLLDDKEAVVESNFIKKVEEKIILKLYTALSRKAKDIFMEDNEKGNNNNANINNTKKEKENKNRILFHKINNIEIPKFKIIDKDDINNDETNNNDNINNNENTEPIFNSLLKKHRKSKTPSKETNEREIEINNSINNLNINFDINNLNNNNNTSRRNSNFNIMTELNEKIIKEKLHFNSDCRYNKKNKNKEKKIKMPTLEPYINYRNNKAHNRKTRKNLNNNNTINPSSIQPTPPLPSSSSWEPDIDCDFLSYINHNIIKIEDIYNKGKENFFEKDDDIKEEDIKTIEAKEVFFDLNQNTQRNNNNNNNTSEKSSENLNKKQNSNISEDDEENELKNKNKFCEYKDRLPNLIEISLQVEPDKKKISDFHKDLKELYTTRINEIGQLDDELFPSNENDLKSEKIYKFAVNNERNEEVTTDSFTLLANQSTDIDVNKNLNNENNNNNNVSKNSFSLSNNEINKDKINNNKFILESNKSESGEGNNNNHESEKSESSKENNEEFNQENNNDDIDNNDDNLDEENNKENNNGDSNSNLLIDKKNEGLLLNLNFSKNSNSSD